MQQNQKEYFMKELIKNYKVSCDMAKERIGELLVQRRYFRKNNDSDSIRQLNLNRRIRLLYKEYCDMREIIESLEEYERSVSKRFH